MYEKEYATAHEDYLRLKEQSQTPASKLEIAAKKLMEAFILKKHPEFLEIAVDSGLAYVLVGIGKDDQPSYLGPYSTREEMKVTRESKKDTFLYTKELQIGSLVNKWIVVFYNKLASAFRKVALR